MNENLTKICRICLTEGSRHIFQKTVAHDALYNVSSLNRISEKLRYVTLLKIDEMENLPPMICDLCIVQLNVAYNFKRQATESDTKLRQYLIENGIDIMKDVRSLPAIRPADQPSAAAIRTLSVPNRTNHRVDSGSSASVFEVPTNRIGATTNGRPFEPRLIPIRIKVETPETVEQSSSDPGDLLSTSTISPLSTATVPPPAPVVTVPSASTVVIDKTNSSENIVIESSPGSSKNSLSSNGRDSAMVVVSSHNISLQGDEDYVQTILGSNSSLSTNASKSVAKPVASSSENSTKNTNAKPLNEKHSSQDHQDSPQEKRLKQLLSSLRINMVTNARFPQSKLRIKPRKKLQKLKQKQQTQLKVTHPTPKRSKTPTPQQPKKVARRPSMDLAHLLNGTRIKKEKTSKKTADHGSPAKKSHIISPGKLSSLRDMIRDERIRQKETSKRHTETAPKVATVGSHKKHDDRSKTAVSS